MESSAFERNPWEEDSSAGAPLEYVLALAQRTGHVKWENSRDDSQVVLHSAKNKVNSLKFIDLLKQLEQTRKQLDDIVLQIQLRRQDKETCDVTHVESVEHKINVINELNAHLQRIVSNKRELISRLQQPLVGDYLKIEAPYKSQMSETVSNLVPVLANLTIQLDKINWLSKLNLSDGQLEAVISDITAHLATVHTGYKNISDLTASLSNYHNRRTGVDKSLVYP